MWRSLLLSGGPVVNKDTRRFRPMTLKTSSMIAGPLFIARIAVI